MALLTGLLIATFTLYDFMNFLTRIRQGNPIALALPVSIIGIGFIMMHKLGLDVSYKEEIEQADHK
jgi:hypothetical protein